MTVNPFRRKTRYERARDDVRKAAKAAATTAGAKAGVKATKKTAQKASAKTADAVEPVPSRARPLLIGGVIAAIVAAIVAARKKSSGPDTPSSGVPSPGTVTPTAPVGPTDDELNDPALKAKVESELFADEDVPKDKISVGAANGVVTLRGRLDSVEETTQITARAEKIDGVRRVENLLTFEPA